MQLKENKTFDAKNYWEKRLSENKNLEGVGYINLGRQFNFWAYKVRKYSFSRLLKKYLSKTQDPDVLDIGSGTGFYINIWERNNAKSISGIDITEVSISQLRLKYPHLSFYRIDIGGSDEQLFEINKKFDFVSCMDVLFHIVDDESYEKAFSNISQLINPGGYFIFTENFIRTKEIRIAHHVSRKKEAIEYLLNKYDFQIMERRSFMYLMNQPIDSSGTIINIFWKTISFAIYTFKSLGYLFGMIMYPLELALVSTTRESPTTEILIAKKIR